MVIINYCWPGIQYAGSHLRELQNAFKHPATHLTLILEEVTKRGLRSVGLGSVPALEHYVDPQLKSEANMLAKVITPVSHKTSTIFNNFYSFILFVFFFCSYFLGCGARKLIIVSNNFNTIWTRSEVLVC